MSLQSLKTLSPELQRGLVLVLLTLLASCPPGLAQDPVMVVPLDGMSLEPAGSTAPATSAQGDSSPEAMQLLQEVLAGIQGTYVTPVSMDELVDAALQGVREQLDPHTKVLSPEEYQALRSRQGASVGIGVTLGITEGRTRIRTVLSGSPAERAGVMPGDQLLSVDGVAVDDRDLERTTALLRGSRGTTARLRCASPNEEARDIAVQRGTVTRDALSRREVQGGRIGCLQIRRFARGTAERVEAILAEWDEHDLAGVIIDLRDNPGGFIDEAARTADLFLPVGAGIVRTVGRLPEENGLMTSQRTPPCDLPPLALLVDSLTASSAEVFAGALKGRPGVVLLGEPTYGKRTVQRLIPLSNGGALKVTASVYITPADPEFEMQQDAEYGAIAPERREEADPTALVGLRGLRARGRRLEPDRLLGAAEGESSVGRLRELGLLQRFLGEPTMTAQDAAGPGFWSAAAAPGEPGGAAELEAWLRGCEGARGFDRWCARLRSRLRDWGYCADLPATPALRRTWVVDWAAERWGAQSAEQAELELDPWIRAATEALDSSRLSCEAAASAPAQRPAPAPVARRTAQPR